MAHKIQDLPLYEGMKLRCVHPYTIYYKQGKIYEVIKHENYKGGKEVWVINWEGGLGVVNEDNNFCYESSSLFTPVDTDATEENIEALL